MSPFIVGTGLGLVACLFVANPAFNNLGFPVLAMAFNWARGRSAPFRS